MQLSTFYLFRRPSPSHLLILHLTTTIFMRVSPNFSRNNNSVTNYGPLAVIRRMYNKYGALNGLELPKPTLHHASYFGMPSVPWLLCPPSQLEYFRWNARDLNKCFGFLYAKEEEYFKNTRFFSLESSRRHVVTYVQAVARHEKFANL